MNDGLQDIYRKRVLEHSRAPHNQRRPDSANREVTGFNPLCGDKLTVYLTVDGDTVTDAAFEGTGCAISIASASMMTDALRGQSTGAALQLAASVDAMFSEADAPADDRLEEVQALAGVRDYPSRVKCATLAWTTAEAALRNRDEMVSTE